MCDVYELIAAHHVDAPFDPAELGRRAAGHDATSRMAGNAGRFGAPSLAGVERITARSPTGHAGTGDLEDVVEAGVAVIATA